MPEGAEILLSVDLIRPLVKDKQITNITLGGSSRYSSKLPEQYNNFISAIQNDKIKIIDINAKGKFIYWTFENNWTMFMTFGMSGQLSPIPGKHICLEIELLDKNNISSKIYFNDPRHFGTIKFTNNPQDLDSKLNELGWDPLATPVNNKVLKLISEELSNHNKPIAEILMDQSIFAGVGNYLRAECLYESKLSPWRISKDLTSQEIEVLCRNIVEIMHKSYENQGATISTFSTPFGAEGKYSTYFKVYGQKQDPNGYKVIKDKTADKRTIHWVPEIQK